MLKKFIFNEKRWTYCRTRPVEGIVRHTVCLFYRRYPFNLQICRLHNRLFRWWKVLTCVDCRVTRSRRNSKKNYALFLNQYNTNIKYTRTYIIFKPKKANKTRNKCTWSKTTKKKKIQQIGHDLISGVQLVVTKSEGIYTCTYVLVPISA